MNINKIPPLKLQHFSSEMPQTESSWMANAFTKATASLDNIKEEHNNLSIMPQAKLAQEIIDENIEDLSVANYQNHPENTSIFEVLKFEGNELQLYETIQKQINDPENHKERKPLHLIHAQQVVARFLENMLNINPEKSYNSEMGNVMIDKFSYNGRKINVGIAHGEYESNLAMKLMEDEDSLSIIISGAFPFEQQTKWNKFIGHSLLLIKLPSESKYTIVDPKSAFGRFFSAPSPVPNGSEQANEEVITAGFQSLYTVDCVRHCATITAILAANFLSDKIKETSIVNACNEIWQQINMSELNSIAFANGYLKADS